MISVVIAMYNAMDVIEPCLKSIYSSNYKDFEVIIVDDGSTDNSVDIVKKYPCRLIELDKNSGPATARNVGVENSRGDIIFFVDSDTEMDENALQEAANTFKENPDIYGVVGISGIKSLRKGLAPNYNALENYYYISKGNGKYVNFFSTQFGSIKKDIFNEVGGFDENFKSADIEDIEFGSRIPEGKIYANKNIIIGHNFPLFKSILKKYFKRSFMMAKFIKNKKGKRFEKSHVTFSRFLGILFVLLSLFSLFLLVFDLRFIYLSLSLFSVFLILSSGLLLFIFKERGLSFMLISIFYKYVFSLAIGLGGVYAIFRRKNESNANV